MAAQALISEKRFTGLGGLAGLKRRPLPMRGMPTAAEESPIPFEYELAFERGEISGRTYKQVVDAALDSVAPGTTMYRTLMREQSQAMRAMQQEEERAAKEGRKLRKLQAQTTVASTLGNTYEDAVYMYDFWIKEGKRAERTGDIEYALTCYRNAGNQRTIADKRATALERKGAAAGKKLETQEAKAWIAENKFEDASHIRKIEEIEAMYQKGELRGNEYEEHLLEEYNTRRIELTDRMTQLEELQAAGIYTLAGNNVANMVETARKELEEGTEENPGIDEWLNKLNTMQLEANKGKYIDVVSEKIEDDLPTGEFEVDRRRMPEGGMTEYMQDELGRYHQIKVATLPAGSLDDEGKPVFGTYLYVEVPIVNKDGTKTVKIWKTETLEGYGANASVESIMADPKYADVAFADEDGNIITDVGAATGSDKLAGRKGLLGSNLLDAGVLYNLGLDVGDITEAIQNVAIYGQEKEKEYYTKGGLLKKQFGETISGVKDFFTLGPGKPAERPEYTPGEGRQPIKLAPTPTAGTLRRKTEPIKFTKEQAAFGPKGEFKTKAKISPKVKLSFKPPPRPRKPILTERTKGATVKWYKPKPKKYQIIKLPKALKTKFPKNYEAQLMTLMKKIKWV
jgi:hypothetical protein